MEGCLQSLFNTHYQTTCQNKIVRSFCQGDHAGRHCKEAQSFKQATFANVPEVDDIFRPILSSSKVEKEQTVKKVKHQRVQAKEESAANYHVKEARKLAHSFYSYDKQQEPRWLCSSDSVGFHTPWYN